MSNYPSENPMFLHVLANQTVFDSLTNGLCWRRNPQCLQRNVLETHRIMILFHETFEKHINSWESEDSEDQQKTPSVK